MVQVYVLLGDWVVVGCKMGSCNHLVGEGGCANEGLEVYIDVWSLFVRMAVFKLVNICTSVTVLEEVLTLVSRICNDWSTGWAQC